MKLKVIIAATATLTIAVVTLMVLMLSEFDLKAAVKEDLNFEFDGNLLAGTLLLPAGEGPFPVVIFIHGDGAQDRFSNDGYVMLMNTFLEHGIACFSWDKPGVGESTGNWLHQSMAMRADEAIVAMQSLKRQEAVDEKAIGFIGFSQGGWVLPEIAQRTDTPAFMIIVSGAVNWQKQGEYLTVKRVEKEGLTPSQIEAVLTYNRNWNELILNNAPYEAYVDFPKNHPTPPGVLTEPMSRDRYRFVTLNMRADAQAGLAEIASPFLGIFGEDDLNVDAAESVEVYNNILTASGHPDYDIVLFPDATHAILKSETYNIQRPEGWGLSTKLLYLIEGKTAHAPGYLDLLGQWTSGRVKN